MFGPKTAYSQYVHTTKYRDPGETFEEAMRRVASAMADDSNHEHAFYNILLSQRFLPAGRIQTAMGSSRATTPYNCFVSGRIEDSFVDGEGSIMQRATEAATTMRLGGGIGYNFSSLRPRGALIKKLMSHSSGPVAFMEIFNAICSCVASAGHRRGAQMAVMSVDHPDISEFIHCKNNQDRLRGFNISVGITDDFMSRVVQQSEDWFSLRFNGETYSTINPMSLWHQIMRSTYDWAEPGVLFLDRINQMNNLYYCETIEATNPCGEQPLPPYGACLLGSFCLPKYVKGHSKAYRRFDWSEYTNDIWHVVRAMDNVIDRALYPLPEQRAEAHSKRRMGLGVTGLANAAEMMGMPYGSTAFLDFEENVFAALRNHAYQASSLSALEKGAFPLYDRDKYMDGLFIAGLPDHIRDHIAKYGIRNSHLTSQAPTGTISMSADNVSSGIEPVFSLLQERLVQTPDGQEKVELADYAYKFHDTIGKTCEEVTISEHLNVLAVAQRYVDSAVSKTCNVPSDIPFEEFCDVYLKAYEMGCKGCTTYRVGGKRDGILSKKPESSCYVDENGRKECE